LDKIGFTALLPCWISSLEHWNQQMFRQSDERFAIPDKADWGGMGFSAGAAFINFDVFGVEAAKGIFFSKMLFGLSLP
jgi:hypothetical protein